MTPYFRATCCGVILPLYDTRLKPGVLTDSMPITRLKTRIASRTPMQNRVLSVRPQRQRCKGSCRWTAQAFRFFNVYAQRNMLNTFDQVLCSTLQLLKVRGQVCFGEFRYVLRHRVTKASMQASEASAAPHRKSRRHECATLPCSISLEHALRLWTVRQLSPNVRRCWNERVSVAIS